jgi:hypothetical protein
MLTTLAKPANVTDEAAVEDALPLAEKRRWAGRTGAAPSRRMPGPRQQLSDRGVSVQRQA